MIVNVKKWINVAFLLYMYNTKRDNMNSALGTDAYCVLVDQKHRQLDLWCKIANSVVDC